MVFRTTIKVAFLFLITLAVSACGAFVKHCPPEVKGDVVYVVSQGWHAEIGIPVAELDANLAFYRDVFPGARVIMFGYGKKTFFTAPVQTFSEYMLGPFPGPAVIHVVGLSATPLAAYDTEAVTVLRLPPGGSKALSEFIWNDLAKHSDGRPNKVARSSNPDGLFYAANSGYSLLHTCNAWTAEALNAAKLPVSASFVMFSGQVDAQVDNAAENQCRLLRN